MGSGVGSSFGEMDLKKKMFFVLKNVLGRTAGAYLLLGIIFYFGMDIRRVSSQARASALNRLRPSFKALREAVMEDKAVPEATLDQFLIYCDKINDFAGEKADAYGLMGYLHYRAGSNDRALHAFEQASRLFPGSFWFHFDAGNLYFEKGEYEKAVDSLGKATRASLETTVNFTVSSRLFYYLLPRDIEDRRTFMLSHFAGAVRKIDRLRVLSYYRMKAFRKAYEYALRAIEREEGGGGFFYYYAGASSYMTGDYGKAVQFLEESARRDPGQYPEVYFLAGRILRKLGKRESAEKFLAHAASLMQSEEARSYEDEDVSIRLF